MDIVDQSLTSVIGNPKSIDAAVGAGASRPSGPVAGAAGSSSSAFGASEAAAAPASVNPLLNTPAGSHTAAAAPPAHDVDMSAAASARAPAPAPQLPPYPPPVSHAPPSRSDVPPPPASSFAGGAAVHPIASLNMYQPNWTIKARVSAKSGVKKYHNQRVSRQTRFFLSSRHPRS